MSWQPSIRATRSGKEFTPFQPFLCEVPSFPSLLERSIDDENERVSSYGREEAPSAFDESPIALVSPPPSAAGRSGSHIVTVNPVAEGPKKLSDSHARRKRKRQARKQEEGQYPRREVLESVVKNSQSLPTTFEFANAPATAGAYGAKRLRKHENDTAPRGLAYFEAEGFTKVEWDATHDRPIVGPDGLIIAVLVAPPKCERFRAHTAEAEAVITAEGARSSFSEEEMLHLRGAFPALNVGIVHGNGTIEPIALKVGGRQQTAETLLNHPSIRALAGFASASFALWNPRVYGYYKEKLDALYAKYPNFKRNFDNSVFPAATFNFGPNAYSFKHRDIMNCPFGWCAIHSLGRFDPKKGGHIVLWELKLVIEFPPGSLIMIPSATLTHSNVPVQKGESRSSFVQYAAGGLFRFVDYGFRTEKQLKRDDLHLFEETMRARNGRWEEALGLMSKLQDLKI